MGTLSLSELLNQMTAAGASDLHLSAQSPPRLRVHGRLCPIDGLDPLTASETKALAYSVMTDAQKRKLEEDLEIDFSFGLKGLARFRANVFHQRGAVGAVFRSLPWEIKVSRAWAFRRRWPCCASGRAGWSWSPGRPARENPPPWPR
ncbi:MAG TPA: hypothetical protein VNJ12_04305 [Candidatus Dormibacteraeota bacterium]|nr:hypothetical protein [Candidatus Dormibacteraeota bacterium]